MLLENFWVFSRYQKVCKFISASTLCVAHYILEIFIKKTVRRERTEAVWVVWM